jgi:hypothetical protein
MFFDNSKAQGTIEYLVIIGVVVVISLVVVSLLTTQTESSVNVSNSSKKLGGLTQSIGITESLVSPNDGNFVVKLLNNSGSTITVSNVKIGDRNVNFSQDLAQSSSKLFKINTGVICEEGKVVSEDVVITYVTEEGLTKIVRYPAQVMFDCTPYTIAQANLANQCPTASYDGNAVAGVVRAGYSFYGNSSTLTAGSLATRSLSASSPSFLAGYYDANDLNTVDTNLAPANIVSGTTIFGVLGTYAGGGGGGVPKTEQTTSYVDYDDGYYEKGLPASGAHYTNNGDGTITDNATGLEWVASPTAAGVGGTYAWADAITACEGLTYAGHSDWRLPNVKELQSIVDYGRVSPAIDTTYFTSESDLYWSSNTYASITSFAWGVNFSYGNAPLVGKPGPFYARPVRGG